MSTRNAALETVELSSSGSESDVTVGGATVKPRPKLRTHRNTTLEEATADSPEVERPTKRRRDASKPVQYFEDAGDEEEDEEEVDEDKTEDYVESVESVETPSEEEKMPEEDLNRRRSGRKRKAVQTVIDLSEDDFMISSDEEEEKPKPKPKKKASAKGKAKGKGKHKRSTSESSENVSGEDSEVEVVETRAKPESDGFIIDKILGREVHTLKEWKKMCWNKNTRFLTHCSIFLPNEEEEQQKDTLEQKEKEEDDKPTPAAPEASEAPSTPKASTEDNEVEDAGEERFLIKWKTLSYLHTSWQTEDELLDTDKNAKGKIQRFREKEHRALYSQEVQGDEYFNPEFRSVDRILEIRDRPLDDFAPDDAVEGEQKFQFFLVKWKALSYDEVTWEREDDVGDDAAVQQYNDRIVRAAKRFKKIALAKHVSNSKRKNFRGYTAEARPPCRKEQTFQLRDYQLTGVNWMLFNWYQKRNSMLADEMGLGKTVQTVMYVNHLAVVERTPNPFIIVAPLSTLGHWQREFDSWTNLNAVVYHGSASAREILQNYEFFLTEDELLRADELSGKKTDGKKASPRPKRNCYRFDVLITTYEMASATDLYKLAQINWQLMVVDEAHRLKNRNSKLSNLLHTRFTYENMLLLTGTPLQNNVEELWVLLNFLDDKKFNSKEVFLESFGELTDSAQVERLHSELKPYLLRRMKEDVEKSLAPKEETIIEVELTVLQKQYYRAIYEKNTEFLSRGGRKGDTPSLMNVLMELRKCCNHPFLVKGVEEREIKRLAKQPSVSKEEIQRQIRESLVDTSGKLVLLDKLLPRLKETGHRVLIFSQFKIMLDIIQDYLALRRYNCERIDGNITGNERQSAIDRYCRKDSNSFIMLLSTRAGGVGINLTAADTVIIYDSDWNPQNDLQAQARCHRIGQKKSVKIYRLLTSKTYELQMFHKASLKLGLDQAVLGGIKNDDPVSKLKGSAKASKPNDRMSKEEIENLLKHGAYEIFKEQESEAEAASKKFGEESIDQILSRSTTIVHDPTRDADENQKKNAMSSFSKATFVSSTNPDEEVDVDDPNFWTKVIGLNGVEEQKKVEASPLQKRRCRRKVKSYLIDDDKAFMVDDSGDDTSSSRKKKSRELGVQKDEEFVISDDDDDDDDDEDDSSDAPLAKDELMGKSSSGKSSSGKRKRAHAPPAIPIFYQTERITELLTTFGYGRWDDIKRSSTPLHVYPDKELIRFAQEYLASLVRVTTAMTAFQRIGLDLDPSRVYIVSTATPPQFMGNASPIERYANELNAACRRFNFLPAMLQDMKVSNLLAVAIPPRMWITDFKSRAARGCRTKLQQIDTMYKLTKFVQTRFVPKAPLVELLKKLQNVGDEAEVHKMIESGTLPVSSTVAVPGDAAVKNDNAILVEGKTNGVISEPSAVKAPIIPNSVAGSNSKGGDAVTVHNPVSSEEEKQDTPPTSCAVVPQSKANDELTSATPAQSAGPEFLEGPETKETTTENEPVSTPTAESSTSDAPPDSTKNVASESSCNEEAKDTSRSNDGADATKSAIVAGSAENPDAEDETGSPALPSDAKELTVPVAAPEEQLKKDPAKVKAEQKLAMRILQALAPVTSPEAVAPWWISRVDDVLLMMYVCTDGWIKGRTLPVRLVDSSSLFGERAKRYPISEWPTLAGLHRRVKVLLHVWTAVKKTKPIAPPPVASVPTPLGVTSAKQQRQILRQQELMKQQLRRQQQEQQRSQQTRHYSSASFHGSRHNQFAKLVFSYGIPDVSTCRDDRERNEKWRYFLQDSQLGIGHYPLEELLAEALDLERVCRQRLQSDIDGRMAEPSDESSILGGKRGFWLLTTTQCRRLLHRVDLFRLLRTQILVLPPAQLVELVSRVVRAQSTSTDYPVWWSCPRHDILLLQGVECYGLDEHLASVWKLPLFNSANTTSSFPSSSWVENYVTALSFACRNLVGKARAYRGPSDGYGDVTSGEATESPAAPDRHSSRKEPTEEAETRRRIRDIRGMREEDPYFVPTVRLRQLIDSNAARDKVRPGESVADNAVKVESMDKQKNILTATEETALMQKEDPKEPKQLKHDEGDPDEKRPSTVSDLDEEKRAPPDDDVIHLESDDDDEDEEEKEEEVDNVARSSSRMNGTARRRRPAATAAKTKRTRSTLRKDKKGSTAAAAGAAKTEEQQSAVRPWDVIVIDSSDEDDSD
ncbi:Chromodomain-helicase-DNA-binding protein 6 [Phytophthora rubi]|uniref:Chromodomain-helicase-DNA-binding protein 6 n=1 Tax=Phytophthora rubi TaxID=129364 RepID=A0A6A4G644_9STRA|nr:Chromodomain-helicase-DNA-binding protein 6 [Phytophthora rubi]KAE9047173.1 Chromodomain-helicase-DNA-binding protein 6 [Phytophthora rubi]KAE9359893.1 Chromodomain-helicase-DNA-binding protein 6 [Phytophthora rubi]